MINCEKCDKNNLKHLTSSFVTNYDNSLFSFKYLTKNNKYNFNRLQNDELNNFKVSLIDKIKKLETEYTTRELMSIRKKSIHESFSIDRIRFKANNINYSNDTKVHVFRVTSDYRMICLFSDVAPIFYIIGFDLRFDAYDHGK